MRFQEVAGPPQSISINNSNASFTLPDPFSRAVPYRLKYRAGAYTASDKALRVREGQTTRDYSEARGGV